MIKTALLALSLLLLQVCANDLPLGWSRHVHEGREYFFNSQTGRTQWEAPAIPTSPSATASSISATPAYPAPYISRSQLLDRKRRARQAANLSQQLRAAPPTTTEETRVNDRKNPLNVGDFDAVQSSGGVSSLPGPTNISGDFPSDSLQSRPTKSDDGLTVVDEDDWEGDENISADVEQIIGDDEQQPSTTAFPPMSPTQRSHVDVSSQPENSQTTTSDYVVSLEGRVRSLQAQLDDLKEYQAELEESVRLAQVSQDSFDSVLQTLRQDRDRQDKELLQTRQRAERLVTELAEARHAAKQAAARCKKEKAERERLRRLVEGQQAVEAEEQVEDDSVVGGADGQSDRDDVDDVDEGKADSPKASIFHRIFRVGRISKPPVYRAKKPSSSFKGAKVLEELRRNVTVLGVLVESRERSLHSISEENEQLRNVTRDLEARCELMNAEKKHMMQQLHDAATQMKDKDIALEELEGHLVDLSSMCQALSRENDVLKAEYQERIADDQASQSLSLAQASLLMQQVSELTSACAQRELDVMQRDNVIQSLQDSCSVLLDKNRRLEEQLANAAKQLYVEQRAHPLDAIPSDVPGGLVAASGTKRRGWWDAIKKWFGFLKFW